MTILPSPGPDSNTSHPPQRIQRRRTAGWRMPEGAVYVGRPSRWGNPYLLGGNYMWLPGEATLTWPIPTYREPGEYANGLRVVRLDDRATAVEWFRRWATECTTAPQSDYVTEARQKLAGRDLACWCPLDQPCHADVLLGLANA